MNHTRKEKMESFGNLLDIMDELRAKCPWDKKQTMESLRHLSIEELYELSDAIIDNDLIEIKKELGDLMLHLVFYAKIGEEKNAFDIKDVLDSISEKLIFRHPHIYGDVEATTEKEVKNNWEKLKLKEGNKSVFSGVPISLPSMIKASRIQEKARGIGFDWENKDQVWDKVLEEIDELKVEIQNNTNEIEDEFGDVLFSLINYARFINVNPDSALEKTNRKFISRFKKMEELIIGNGLVLADMNLNEMDIYWEKAKKLTK